MKQYPQRVLSRIKATRPRGVYLQAGERPKEKPPTHSKFIGQLSAKTR